MFWTSNWTLWACQGISLSTAFLWAPGMGRYLLKRDLKYGSGASLHPKLIVYQVYTRGV